MFATYTDNLYVQEELFISKTKNVVMAAGFIGKGYGESRRGED